MNNRHEEDTKSYIDNKIGLIRVFNKETLTKIKQEEVVINGKIIKAGDRTTLDDFFESEAIYLGIYDGYMQFQIGIDLSLFEDNIYTNELKKIEDNRILTIYQIGTARDHIFKNGVWK